MTRCCHFCGAPIEGERRYCSQDCRKAAAKEKRAEKARRVCRLCGRGTGSMVKERNVRRRAAEAARAALLIVEEMLRMLLDGEGIGDTAAEVRASLAPEADATATRFETVLKLIQAALAESASLDAEAARRIRSATKAAAIDSGGCAESAQVTLAGDEPCRNP